MQQSRGHATGYHVYYSPLMKRWQWSAYGPNGGQQGTAPDKTEAERRAIAARDSLNQRRSTTDG